MKHSDIKIMQLMTQIKDVCIEEYEDEDYEPTYAVVALTRMVGFMLMLCTRHMPDEMEFNREETYAHIVKEIDHAYDGAIAAKETQRLMNKVSGGTDD